MSKEFKTAVWVALVGILGFCGQTLWSFNERLARIETRLGLASAPRPVSARETNSGWPVTGTNKIRVLD